MPVVDGYQLIGLLIVVFIVVPVFYGVMDQRRRP